MPMLDSFCYCNKIYYIYNSFIYVQNIKPALSQTIIMYLQNRP